MRIETDWDSREYRQAPSRIRQAASDPRTSGPLFIHSHAVPRLLPAALSSFFELSPHLVRASRVVVRACSLARHAAIPLSSDGRGLRVANADMPAARRLHAHVIDVGRGQRSDQRPQITRPPLLLTA